MRDAATSVGLVVVLHKQLIARMQRAAAGSHQDGRNGRSLRIGDDPGVTVLAITAEDDQQLGFASGPGDHESPRRKAGVSKLALKDAYGGPHNVGFGPAAVRDPRAGELVHVFVADALDILRQRYGLVG
jgi:hypothetical protein